VATDATPIWSPDGQRLVFRSNRRSLHDLYERPANSSGRDRLVHHSSAGLYPTDWAQDGRTILYHSRQQSHYDIYKLDIESPAEAALIAGPHDEAQAQMSAQGQLAYMSDESGQPNIYVAGFDPPEAPLRVSVENGIDPRWRADGRQLFYLTLAGDLMAADIGRSPSSVMRTTRLFATGVEATESPYLSNYVVSKTGQRFLMKMPIDRAESQPITVTMNWSSLR
jgi:Tol biopolymer transport system component